ncbi:hypothetical protein CVD28_24600 [Bacillus sp. M6-12]|uniref:hypothetical protein n=1 Tax=Bacillus sp. M6-12 TaxID=2054166 RepID=UPI000C76D85E|nr:hypothetical protein [Bacillus sp. M6-12]PLS15062.1 hypothetical protein CVD28_24600 [Bacillus sp. M6-12]
MKESDLFLPVKKFLLESGYSNVYGEVGKCDVLGVNGECNIIVELKTTLSFKLIDQAIERLKQGHYVYIAIPKRKQSIPKCVKEILTYHKIGLIEVGMRSFKVTIPARFNRLANKRKSYKRLRKNIKEYSEGQIGGVKSGEKITDYSITMQNIKEYMKSKRNKWVTVDDILEHCETHYKKPKTSVMATLKAEWNQDWCESKIENRKRYFRMKEEVFV